MGYKVKLLLGFRISHCRYLVWFNDILGSHCVVCYSNGQDAYWEIQSADVVGESGT